VLVHLDTDLGGDPDDVCALAMLLGWPAVEIAGISTTIDPGGVRAGYVRHVLELAGRPDVPVAAGAEVSLTRREPAHPATDERYWPPGLEPVRSPPGAALDLMRHSIDRGATVVAIGPQTNLALLEVARPGSLAGVPVVAMGGWVRAPEPGLPAWGPERDFNVAWDLLAAQVVAEAARDLTLVTLADTVRTHLREADLPRLRAAGPLGQLVARQAPAYAADCGHAALGRAHAGLPDDLLLFLHDPLACAVAVGWDGCRTQEMRLRPEVTDGALRFVPDTSGRAVTVVTDVDPAAFARRWLDAVTAGGAQAAGRRQ
jgi:inosine-uridine nucleoside N-ribohydrolase